MSYIETDWFITDLNLKTCFWQRKMKWGLGFPTLVRYKLTKEDTNRITNYIQKKVKSIWHQNCWKGWVEVRRVMFGHLELPFSKLNSMYSLMSKFFKKNFHNGSKELMIKKWENCSNWCFVRIDRRGLRWNMWLNTWREVYKLQIKNKGCLDLFLWALSFFSKEMLKISMN